MTFATGTRVTHRPTLAAALLQAWRTHREHEQLLPTGPAEHDADRHRAQTDLHAARPDT